MKLLITGTRDVRSVDFWSGIPYYLSRALAARFEVCFEGDLFPPTTRWQNLLRRWYWHTKQGWHMEQFEKQVMQACARKVERAIEREKPDAVLSIQFIPIAELETDVPVYLTHDVTFRLLLNYYNGYTGLSARTRAAGEQMQGQALARCRAAAYSSHWAARSATGHYGADEAKVHVVPYGANMDDAPTEAEVEKLIAQRLEDVTVHFLFVGVEWARKGGPLAVQLVRQILDRGIQAKLDIVGGMPPDAVKALPFVTCHGFLSKKDAGQAAQLRSLYARARFFIMPSEAECYGCVFCEANAFGLPLISRRTGGIGEIVKEGVNGYLLARGEVEERVVAAVLRLCEDGESYRKMARQAWHEYEARLNWETFARRFEEIVHQTARS